MLIFIAQKQFIIVQKQNFYSRRNVLNSNFKQGTTIREINFIWILMNVHYLLHKSNYLLYKSKPFIHDEILHTVTTNK